MAASVIIPVFNAHAELSACLQSVAATVGSETQVIVIDDASTDARIVPLIESAVAGGGPRWRFVKQAKNAGFVATANLGMRLVPGDVVLLNSDTEVTLGWFERLQACLDSNPRIATATPWSNNAEIASIPRFCHPGVRPPEPARIAEIIARTGAATYPELPTAVGFCMAISRKALDSVGAFDEERFGLGYGEENDFCMRAVNAGFRNVLCDDCYVVHHGGRSFGPRGLGPDEQAMNRLLERHPGYLELVEEFIEADPLADRRRQLVEAVEAAGVGFD